jgi:hypothetical protein
VENELMSEPPPDNSTEETQDDTQEVVDNKKKTTKPLTQFTDGQSSPPATPPVPEVTRDDVEKLQKRLYNAERKQVLSDLQAINPDIAEKYKSAKLDKLVTIYETIKEIQPKLSRQPVGSNPAAPTPSKKNYFDRRKNEWV